MPEPKKHALVADSLTIPAMRIGPVRTVHHLETATTPWLTADVATWYRARVARLIAQGLQSTRAEDEAAARVQFGRGWSKAVRDLRRSSVPQDWQEAGRRPGQI